MLRQICWSFLFFSRAHFVLLTYTLALLVDSTEEAYICIPQNLSQFYFTLIFNPILLLKLNPDYIWYFLATHYLIISFYYFEYYFILLLLLLFYIIFFLFSLLSLSYLPQQPHSLSLSNAYHLIRKTPDPLSFSPHFILFYFFFFFRLPTSLHLGRRIFFPHSSPFSSSILLHFSSHTTTSSSN